MRKFLLAVACIAVLLIGGLVVAFVTVDVNQFRPFLVARMAAATGHHVELAAIHRSWTGGFGLELRRLVVSDDPRFGAEPLLAVEQATARLKLAPLLHRQLELATITLDHPVIHLVKNAAGQLNVQALGPTPPATGHRPPAASQSAVALPFLVSALKIRSAAISYRDLSATTLLTVEVQDADVSATDIRLVRGVPTATLDIRNGRVALSRMNKPMDSIAVDARVTPEQLDVTKLTALIGNGAIEGAATVRGYRSQPQLDAKLSLNNVLVQEVGTPAMARAEQRLEGKLSGRATVHGTGAAWPALQQTLSGQVEAHVTEARVTNLNILREALTKISILPGVVERLEAKLPERYQQLLTQRDTAIRTLTITGRLEQGALLVDPLQVVTETGTLSGRGRVGLDGTVDLAATIVIPPDLSAALVRSVGELSSLADASGAITFPLRVSGTPPRIAVQPDLNYITQRAGTQLIDRFLEKALGGKQPSAAPQTTTDNATAPSSEKPSTEQLIRDLFRKKR